MIGERVNPADRPPQSVCTAVADGKDAFMMLAHAITKLANVVERSLEARHG